MANALFQSCHTRKLSAYIKPPKDGHAALCLLASNSLKVAWYCKITKYLQVILSEIPSWLDRIQSCFCFVYFKTVIKQYYQDCMKRIQNWGEKSRANSKLCHLWRNWVMRSICEQRRWWLLQHFWQEPLNNHVQKWSTFFTPKIRLFTALPPPACSSTLHIKMHMIV